MEGREFRFPTCTVTNVLLCDVFGPWREPGVPGLKQPVSLQAHAGPRLCSCGSAARGKTMTALTEGPPHGVVYTTLMKTRMVPERQSRPTPHLLSAGSLHWLGPRSALGLLRGKTRQRDRGASQTHFSEQRVRARFRACGHSAQRGAASRLVSLWF